jgi:phage terminase large subunit GpA-like protein
MSGLLKAFQDALKPIARLKPSEWADKNRVLSSVSSSEPGPWRNSRVPYLVEIMDCFSPYSPYKEVVIMKGSQTGVTEAAMNVTGFYIDNNPCPIMYVMPTEATVKRNSKIRFDPMVEASPNLKAKVSTAQAKDKTNTILEKSFNGGVLIFAGANSPASLRSVPVLLMILDEVDAMPRDVGGEGNPVDLARARTTTFAQKKIMLISTPTIEGGSLIEDEYLSTDQRRFFIPCPECGLMQTLEWENLKWENSEDVRYKCDGCDHLIEERQKPYMFKLGEWRPTKKENISRLRAGFHVSGLYSPLGWLSWSEIVQAYEKAGTDATKLKVFHNTMLGESYKEKGDAPEWEGIYKRRENYPTYSPPKAVKVITVGVDVQKDRLELEVKGWGEDRQSWSIDYRVLIGETSKTGPGTVWAELGKVVTETWTREDGKILPMSRMAVDSGYNTSEVYKFCALFDPNRVSAVKGRENLNMAVSAPRPITFLSNGKPVKFSQLWGVGSSFLKYEIYGQLRLTLNEDGSYPGGYAHYPTAYEPHFFRMLTAEVLQKRIVKGFPVYEWVKTYARNESLDTFVYARAALSMMGVDSWRPEHWKSIEDNYSEQKQPTQQKRKRPDSIWG